MSTSTTCAACGAAAAALRCPGCGGQSYCGDKCRQAAWAAGHGRDCARVFCERLAKSGSPKFFLPEAPEAPCEPVSLAAVRQEAAARPRTPPRSPPPSPRSSASPGADAAAVAERALRRQAQLGAEADAFIRDKEPGYWDTVVGRGMAAFRGLRFVINVRLGGGEPMTSFLVEGTGENVPLPLVEANFGMGCITRRLARDVVANADRLFRALEECAEDLRLNDGYGGGLIARFEDSRAPHLWCLRKVRAAARPPVRNPWWRAALPREAVADLVTRKNAANELFVKRDLEGALRGYDAVVAEVERACARGDAGPCAATQKLLATCLANRAACRVEVGGVSALERAEDDCRDALEGPWTAWLRHRFDEPATRLNAKTMLRRKDARERLEALLRAAGPLPVDGARPTEPDDAARATRVDTNGDEVTLTAHATGAGWAAREVRDAPSVLFLAQFSRVAHFGPLPLPRAEVLAKAARGGGDGELSMALTPDGGVEVTLGARAFRRQRGYADTLLVATAKKMVLEARRKSGRKPARSSGRAPFCPVCDVSTAGGAAAAHGLRRLPCGKHFACADCVEAWCDALAASGREAACPCCHEAQRM